MFLISSKEMVKMANSRELLQLPDKLSFQSSDIIRYLIIYFFLFQDLKNQILTTNLWVKTVSYYLYAIINLSSIKKQIMTKDFITNRKTLKIYYLHTMLDLIYRMVSKFPSRIDIVQLSEPNS